jgi:DNA-directed RNA polymerase subunit K/omega
MIDRSKLMNSFEFVVMAGARARQLMLRLNNAC